MMVRTQIQLPEEQYQELRSRAAREHRSLADCIREAIRLFLLRDREHTLGLEDIAGKFRPLPLEDLKPHDRELVHAITRSKKRSTRSR
jgi:plasmid stability protein